MEFTIKGQPFMPATRLTLARISWMGKWAARAKLDELATLTPPQDERQAYGIMQDLVRRARDADAVIPILAGGYERLGQPWTEAQAAENMLLLAEWDNPAAFDQAFAEVLIGFMSSEPALWRAMLACSSPRNGASADASSPPPPPPSSPGLSPPISVAETSVSSLGPSPAMTPTGSG